MRGHCCISPARREAVFWAAEAAIGRGRRLETAALAASRRVNVPGIKVDVRELQPILFARGLRFAPRRLGPESRRGIVQGAAR